MAEVTVYDAIRMKAIEDNTVVNGEIDPVTGHLMLTRFNETEIDAGLVNVSPRIVTSGTRPVTDLSEGIVIYETDTNRFYVYDGANWQPRGVGFFICTSATRPANPFQGLHIYETNTGLVYFWSGSAWLIFAPSIPHSSSVRVSPAGATTTSAAFVALGVTLGIANFPKLRSDTKLIATYEGSVLNDSGLGQYEVAILINGVDNVVAGGFSNTGGKAGTVEVTGLAAGNYTCSVRKRRANATGNVSDGDTGGRNCLTITETY